MTILGEVLVAILNNEQDMSFAREYHWYRIPIESAEKFLKRRNCWPPRWLAFYQTRAFGQDAFAVNYYAAVQQICEVSRPELFPDEIEGQKRNQRYYKLELSPLERLERPIVSKRLRRVTFIPTTWEKFMTAREISEL